MVHLTCLESRKSDLGGSRVVEQPVPSPGPGEIVTRTERISLTTNNLTYAVYGDTIGYWNLFPTGDAEYGRIPAWGFAEVIESRVPGISAGVRVFGYFPIATHLVMQPTAVTSRGFVDGAPHRTGTPKVYNLYEFQTGAAQPSTDSFVSIFRALFMLSFTAADYLRDREFFAAEQIVVSSASSKTAYGFAHCVSDFPGETIALTSPRNLSFVEGLSCYDAVHDYADLASIDRDRPTLYLDLSGNDVLRRRVHEHFGDRLVHDCLVGSTQSTNFLDRDESVPGPAPEFFFAAVQLDAYKAAGESRAFMERYLRDERAFLERVADRRNPWMTLDEHVGLDDAPAVVEELHRGVSDPSVGHVFTFDVT